MFHVGDRVRVTEGTIFGHHSGHEGTVVGYDDHINTELPVSVEMDDRAAGKLMIDAREHVAHFEPEDLVMVERAEVPADEIICMSPSLATMLGIRPQTDG